MVVFPNAKINIGLNIIRKRADGFHNLESVFYPIGLTDILEVITVDNIEEEKIEFSNSGIEAGDLNDNLIVKAFHILNKDFNLPSVKAHLHKIIPIGAGLGGGSSDASFMLKALNEMFELRLDVDRLEHYASQLGSDCAFFVKNTPAFAEEKGEDLSPIHMDLSKYTILLICPPIYISTAQAYSGIKPQKPEVSLQRAIKKDITLWRKNVKNDFEEGVFAAFSEIEAIKKSLYKLGAIYASMSGSGSSVFGIFESLPEEDFQKLFPGSFIWNNRKD